MKKIFLLSIISILVVGCAANKKTQDIYVLEKYNESNVPVCVKYSKVMIEKEKPCTPNATCKVDACGNSILTAGVYEESKDVCDVIKPEIVTYTYCLNSMPKPVHLVIKKDNDMTICYDRNNDVKLPIKYCLPNTNVMNNVNPIILN